MIPWLLKNPALSAALGGCLVLAGLLGVSRVQLAGARADGATAGLAVAQGAAELAGVRADIAEQREKFEREARAKEQQQREALDGVAAEFHQELQNAQTSFDRTVADLRNGAVRVQRRLQCPPVADAASGGSTGAASGSVDHGAAYTGLTDADVEAALGIAADGDAAIVQLGACQAAVRVMQGAGQ